MKISLKIAVLGGALAFNFASPLARAQHEDEPPHTPALTWKSRARLHSTKRSGKNWQSTIAYPVFRADTPLARYTTWQGRLWTQEHQTKAIAQIKDYLKDDAQPMGQYFYQLKPELMFYGPHLISQRLNISVYYGGAHPNTIIYTTNYGIADGRPRQLTLGDFFVPGSAYRAQTAAKIVAKLKQDERATWIEDGTVKGLTTYQLNSSVVKPDGLTWVFSPYIMGPYSAGIIETALNLRELGPNFQRELLAK